MSTCQEPNLMLTSMAKICTRHPQTSDRFDAATVLELSAHSQVQDGEQAEPPRGLHLGREKSQIWPRTKRRLSRSDRNYFKI